MNPAGDIESGQASLPTPFRCWVPINKMMQAEDALGDVLNTEPIRFKYGTYWWVLQCIATNDGTSSDTVVSMDFQSHVHYRDV